MTADESFAGAYAGFREWLLAHAYPVWAQHGVDRDRGGCHESLALDGTPTDAPRRARLHPRQAFAFAHAPQLGWTGPASDVVEHALCYFIEKYTRSDGLIRAVVNADGSVKDEMPLLYDQAFALLGFASAFALTKDARWRHAAHTLREAVLTAFVRPVGFSERLDGAPPLLANSHMHLLEACLAWCELDTAASWHDIGSHIVELARDRLLHPHAHVITEFFDSEWRPLATEQGRLVEPGHLFEWGWLLLRGALRVRDPRLEQQALRLIDIADATVDARRHVAMNSCIVRDDALVVHDPRARLWPQTERIKALVLAARTTGEARYLSGAVQALRCVQRYLDVPLPGLWRDVMNVDGTFVVGPAPASSFYHLVGAALVCERSMSRSDHDADESDEPPQRR